MITTPKRRSPKATISKIAVERAMLVLQQLPPKFKPTPAASTAATPKRGRDSINPSTKSTRSTAKKSIVAALNATAIAEKKAFLNRKIKDVISVLLDDSPPKVKKNRKAKT